MNTHETYVSLEVAKLLKESGFDWECVLAYCPTTKYGNVPFEHFTKATNYNGLSYEVYSAPTLAVAQRWLKEVKGIYIDVLTDFDCLGVFYVVRYMYKDKRVYILDEDCEEYAHKIFKSYEEALEAGIKKCLDLILEEE